MRNQLQPSSIAVFPSLKESQQNQFWSQKSAKVRKFPFLLWIKNWKLFQMSLVCNTSVQIFPLRKNFHALLMSLSASKRKQSAGVRLSEETLTCIMERCVSIAQTKQRRLQTFLPLQSLCKSPIHFTIPHISAEKSEINEEKILKKTWNQKVTETF